MRKGIAYCVLRIARSPTFDQEVEEKGGEGYDVLNLGEEGEREESA